MSRLIDLSGRQFGRLKVLHRAGRRGSNALWQCTCECGNTPIVASQLLRFSKTTSCGCLRAENVAAYATKHGKDRTPEHRSWVAMRQRCGNPKDSSYPYYGGRGVTVCDRWLHGEGGVHPFECFLADMGPKPYPEATLDREEPDGNYEPGNCRWASRQEQSANQRRFKEVKASV